VTTLPYVWWCNHLTQTDCEWRRVDYDGRAFVRGIKKEPFNGYLEVKLNKVSRRYTKADIEHLVADILPRIGERLRKDIDGPISLVPIPNSGMAIGADGPFRAVELAGYVAKGFGKDCEVCPALRWDKQREQAHKGHEHRTPELYEPHLRVVSEPKHPFVLFDDVLTSGSQMIAAARVLTKEGFAPRRGLVIAKAIRTQEEGPLFTRREGELELESDPFDFDEF
jgi:hypothetical protein